MHKIRTLALLAFATFGTSLLAQDASPYGKLHVSDDDAPYFDQWRSERQERGGGAPVMRFAPAGSARGAAHVSDEDAPYYDQWAGRHGDVVVTHRAPARSLALGAPHVSDDDAPYYDRWRARRPAN